METEQRTFFDKNGNEVVVDVPKRKKRNNGGCLKWAVIIVGALFLLGFCGAMLSDSGDESDTEETTEEVAEQTEGAEEEISEEETESEEVEEETQEVISVTADEILSAYKENEVNANSVYKGNLIELTGKLSSISESDSGKVSLVVKPDSDELWLEDVSVELENSEGIENLFTDSEITVMGTADTGILYTVVLKKASIVQ